MLITLENIHQEIVTKMYALQLEIVFTPRILFNKNDQLKTNTRLQISKRYENDRRTGKNINEGSGI